jgi:hypothetical protein
VHVIAEAGGNFIVSPSWWVVTSWVAVPVGGLVTAAKGRWGWLLVGVFLAGLIWPLTALLIATPDSIWGRAFYHAAKMTRARRRFPRRLPYALQ